MSRPDQARRALERVCSGRELESIEEVYSPQFVDHVNDFEYHGIKGARRSVALYRQLGLWRSTLLLLTHRKLLRAKTTAARG